MWTHFFYDIIPFVTSASSRHNAFFPNGQNVRLFFCMLTTIKRLTMYVYVIVLYESRKFYTRILQKIVSYTALYEIKGHPVYCTVQRLHTLYYPMVFCMELCCIFLSLAKYSTMCLTTFLASFFLGT